MATVNGLRTCDTCKKAVKALEEDGLEPRLRDVSRDRPTRQELQRWWDSFGENLVNRRSRTWRELSEDERELPALDLLEAHPSLMKRPVIEIEAARFLGWSEDTRAAVIAAAPS